MDEVEKRPEGCRNSLLEMLDHYGCQTARTQDLNLYEKEALRYLNMLHRPFSLRDIQNRDQIVVLKYKPDLPSPKDR